LLRGEQTKVDRIGAATWLLECPRTRHRDPRRSPPQSKLCRNTAHPHFFESRAKSTCGTPVCVRGTCSKPVCAGVCRPLRASQRVRERVAGVEFSLSAPQGRICMSSAQRKKGVTSWHPSCPGHSVLQVLQGPRQHAAGGRLVPQQWRRTLLPPSQPIAAE